jgi:hypothetical protein
MNVLKILCLCPIILAASAAAQISVSVPTDETQADVVARVQATLASQLDEELPNIGLGEWLLEVTGPDAKVTWSYSQFRMGLCGMGRADHYCDCGSANAVAKTYYGRVFFVQIAVGGACSVPVFDTGMMAAVSKKEGGAFIYRLSDLPRRRWQNSRSSQRSEGMK